MTDTRTTLGSINVEQLAAIVEIIREAPKHADVDIIADVVETTVREAVDRRFELEKLTKIAANAVFAETGAEPSDRMVDIVVASVWDQVHRAQNPDGHDHDGLLPGLDNEQSINELTIEYAEQGEPQTVTIEHTAENTADMVVVALPQDMTGVVVGTPQSGVQVTDDGGTVGVTDAERSPLWAETVSTMRLPLEPDENGRIASSPVFGANKDESDK